jgi:hypothetical protein
MYPFACNASSSRHNLSVDALSGRNADACHAVSLEGLQADKI